MRLQRRGGRKLIMTPEGVAAPARKPSRDETLGKAIVRAHRWRRKIESGQGKVSAASTTAVPLSGNAAQAKAIFMRKVSDPDGASSQEFPTPTCHSDGSLIAAGLYDTGP
jgi:hypothetical protein